MLKTEASMQFLELPFAVPLQDSLDLHLCYVWTDLLLSFSQVFASYIFYKPFNNQHRLCSNLDNKDVTKHKINQQLHNHKKVECHKHFFRLRFHFQALPSQINVYWIHHIMSVAFSTCQNSKNVFSNIYWLHFSKKFSWYNIHIPKIYPSLFIAIISKRYMMQRGARQPMRGYQTHVPALTFSSYKHAHISLGCVALHSNVYLTHACSHPSGLHQHLVTFPSYVNFYMPLGCISLQSHFLLTWIFTFPWAASPCSHIFI